MIFAFGGCVLIGSSLYIVQRTSRQTLFGAGDWLRFLYQAFTSRRTRLCYGRAEQEYAEPEWYAFFSPLLDCLRRDFIGTVATGGKATSMYNWFLTALF